jgi:hypothetical protein
MYTRGGGKKESGAHSTLNRNSNSNAQHSFSAHFIVVTSFSQQHSSLNSNLRTSFITTQLLLKYL